MGIANNCLLKNIKFDEISMKPAQNVRKNNEFNNSNFNNNIKVNDFINNNKFEIENQGCAFNYEKNPDDNFSNKNINNKDENKEKLLKMTNANNINIIENQNITNFNNIRFNNGIILNENILFNSTRKSVPIKKKFEKYKYNFNDNKNSNVKFRNSFKSNITKENANLSENNFGSNKVMNSEEESDNLIVIDYNNNQDNMKFENNININNINGYNNDDGFIKNIKKINEVNDETKKENIIDTFDNNNKNLILDNNNINKENYISFMKKYNINSENKEKAIKTDINEQTQKSDKTIKNDFIETNNIFKNNVPYSKPKLNFFINGNIQENNKNIISNNKNINKIIDNNKEEQNDIPKDHDEFFNSKKKDESIDSENNNNNLEKENNDIILKENQNVEDNNFISNVRKINPILDENIPPNKYALDDQKIDIEQNLNEDINEIYKTPVIENNKSNKIYNPEINLNKDNQELNEEYENENDEINNNMNNKEQITDPDGKILYQTATMDNIQDNIIKTENNDYKNSNSLFNSNELNEGIISPILQDKNKYFPSNQNSIQANTRYPNNDYEKENNNSDNQENNESEQNSNSQQEPRDKDSELEATPKISEKHKYLLENKQKNIIKKNMKIIYENNNKEDHINNYEDLNDKNDKEIENQIQNNIYQKKIWQKLTDDNLMNQDEQIINNGDLITQIIPKENLFTPSKNMNKIYKKKYISDTSQKTEIKRKEPENTKIIKENEDITIEEFKDFDWDEWKRFYPENDRFFKFPNEGIIHNQEIKDDEKGEIYQGDLNKNGEKHGHGKFISKTLKRIGMWRRNNFTGWGKEFRQNGDVYEGKFINGELNGKGFYKNKIKNITYIGEFINSEKHGKGELFTKDYHYKGDFIKNKFEGYGKIELYNEGEYEGTFKNGLFDGKGMLRWKDGGFYKGELSKGKQDGYGEETSKDGNIYKGYYSKGNKHGEGKFYTTDGNVYNCLFQDGKSIKNVDNN